MALIKSQLAIGSTFPLRRSWRAKTHVPEKLTTGFGWALMLKCININPGGKNLLICVLTITDNSHPSFIPSMAQPRSASSGFRTSGSGFAHFLNSLSRGGSSTIDRFDKNWLNRGSITRLSRRSKQERSTEPKFRESFSSLSEVMNDKISGPKREKYIKFRRCDFICILLFHWSFRSEQYSKFKFVRLQPLRLVIGDRPKVFSKYWNLTNGKEFSAKLDDPIQSLDSVMKFGEKVFLEFLFIQLQGY